MSAYIGLTKPSPNAQGAIVAAMPAGSFVGALAVSALADRFGRKKTVILSGIIWVIGSILQCASIVCIFYSESFPFRDIGSFPYV